MYSKFRDFSLTRTLSNHSFSLSLIIRNFELLLLFDRFLRSILFLFLSLFSFCCSYLDIFFSSVLSSLILSCHLRSTIKYIQQVFYKLVNKHISLFYNSHLILFKVTSTSLLRLFLIFN